MINNLKKEIQKYCEVNALDYKKFKDKLLRSGFNFEKYGTKPEIFGAKTQVIEKIVEVIKEVPKDNKEISSLLERYEQEILEKSEKIIELENKLKEKNRPNDLYGDSRVGSYGSNTK